MFCLLRYRVPDSIINSSDQRRQGKKMTKSEIFKKAHQATKMIMQEGDDYRATFSLALKEIYKYLAEQEPTVWEVRGNTFAVKDALKAAGYMFDGIRKIWFANRKPSCTTFAGCTVSAY